MALWLHSAAPNQCLVRSQDSKIGWLEDPYCLLQSCHRPMLLDLLRLVMVGSRLERWIVGHSIRVFFCLFLLAILLLVFILFMSLWKSKWERTKHQLTQRLQTHLTSLHVLAFAVRDRLHVERQRLCLCLGDASSQILSWMGNLHVEWWSIYNGVILSCGLQ